MPSTHVHCCPGKHCNTLFLPISDTTAHSGTDIYFGLDIITIIQLDLFFQLLLLLLLLIIIIIIKSLILIYFVEVLIPQMILSFKRRHCWCHLPGPCDVPWFVSVRLALCGVKHHEEADTKGASPPPHNDPLFQCSLVGFYSFIIRSIKQNSFPIHESIEPLPLPWIAILMPCLHVSLF